MSRLPTVGGDTDNWGTVLNDYLTETASPVTSLATSPTVGATSFDLAVIPATLATGAMIAIDAYTTQCEIRQVTAITGNTVTVTALKYAHTEDDTVLVLNDRTVSPAMFAIVTGSTDNWGPLQRAILETTSAALKFQYTGGLAGNVFQVSKPICVPTSSQWQDIGIKTHSSFAPIEVEGGLCMVALRVFSFTATAADNLFTVAAGHGMGSSGSYSEVTHTKVVFNNPYGETLPGGITAGQVYWIKTTPSGTTFTVSATEGGPTLDVTSDGAGTAWEGIDELSRVYWDNVRFDLTVADCRGIRVAMQQPSYIRNLRVEMDAAATDVDIAYGIIIQGQIGYLENVEVNPANNCTGLYLGGTGICVRGFNCNGADSGTTGAVINGDNLSIHDIWTESCYVEGIRLNGGRGIHLGGQWIHVGDSAPALRVMDSQISYDVGQIRMSSGTACIVLEDVDRGFTMYSTGGAVLGSVVTDYNNTFPGWTQPSTLNGAIGPYPPTFNARLFVSLGSGAYSVRYIDNVIAATTASGALTCSLPAAAGWGGLTYTFIHTAGANTFTVDTVGSETIDGGASITVALDETVTIVNDGVNYRVLA